MNHDLLETFREKLDNLPISDYHGLNSPGLLCYLNSVLQVLFMTEDFRDAVKRCCSEESTTIDPQLERLFADLQKSTAKTNNLTRKLGITDVYEQRDAAEYFEKILCLTSPEAATIFKGELNHKTMCLGCKERNDSTASFWILPLAVEDLRRQTYNVESGLKAFFKGEKVCGDNKVYCNQCNEKQDADFGCEMTQSPKILTLLLKRFSFDYERRCYVKLHCDVDVPQTLHLETCIYDLYALVHHLGNLTGGHYTAQIKSFETDTWYHFDDRIVNKVSPPLFRAGHTFLRSCSAYLLMYRKVSRHAEKPDEGDRQSLCTHVDVDAEGRRDQTERGAALVPELLKDDSSDGGGNLKRLNSDVLKKSHDDAVGGKETNVSWEQNEQLNSRGTLLQTDGEGCRPSLQTQTVNVAKPQKDGTRSRSKPAEVLKNKREAVREVKGNGAKLTREPCFRANYSDVKSLHGSSNGFASSTRPYLTGHMQQPSSMHQPGGCGYSPNHYFKSFSPPGGEEKVLHAVTADSSCRLTRTQTGKRGEITASPRAGRRAAESHDKFQRGPWK